MSASGEAAIVETRRDLRLLPAVANALAHLPPSWRINLIHGGQLSPSCVVGHLGAPDRLRLRHVREISDVAWRESTNASTHKLRKSPKQWYNNLLASTVFWDAFSAAYVLIFEADAALCPSPSTPLLALLERYDVLGSPWAPGLCEMWWRNYRSHLEPPFDNRSVSCCCNSGLSLWRRALIRETVAQQGHTYRAMPQLNKFDVWASLALQRRHVVRGEARARLPDAATAASFGWEHYVPPAAAALTPIGAHGAQRVGAQAALRDRCPPVAALKRWPEGCAPQPAEKGAAPAPLRKAKAKATEWWRETPGASCARDIDRVDGLGSQLVYKMCAHAYAHMHNLTFAPRPLRVVRGVSARNRSSLTARANALLPPDVAPTARGCHHSARRSDAPPCRDVPLQCQVQLPLRAYEAIMPRYRARLAADGGDGRNRTCMHVRRGDVGKGWTVRYVSPAAYFAERGELPTVVHTETRNNDVTWCQREVGCELRLDADVLAMIRECVAAARFVGTAQSGLSLLIALYREGPSTLFYSGGRHLAVDPPRRWRMVPAV